MSLENKDFYVVRGTDLKDHYLAVSIIKLEPCLAHTSLQDKSFSGVDTAYLCYEQLVEGGLGRLPF